VTVAFHTLYLDCHKASQVQDNEIHSISRAVCSAAQQYAIPANRSLCIECGFALGNLQPAEVADHSTLLCTAIQEMLPSGCKLASVEFCLIENESRFTYCQCICPLRAFWVVVVEPLQPIA
jgi:hypothetical protein